MSGPPSSDVSLSAVRDLERSLDARQRARAEAARIVSEANEAAASMITEARARGEAEATARREEIVSATDRDAAEARAQADSWAAELSATVSRRSAEIDDVLFAIVVPRRSGDA